MRIKIALITVLMAFNVNADDFKLVDRTISLPLPSKWLAKSPEKNSLVFFDASAKNPRLIISVYPAPFIFPGPNVSEFESIYEKEKVDWEKSVEASRTEKPQFSYDSSKKTATIKYFFEFQGNSFEERVRFYDCGNGDGMAIKAMIPKSVTVPDSLSQAFEAPLCK